MESNLKFDLYCWASDFSSKRGEGILARDYILNLSMLKNKRFLIRSPDSLYRVYNNKIKKIKRLSVTETKLNLTFFENYISPLIGILYLWKNFIKGRGVCYLNFLPLWNFLIFALLPPKTHLGPITGFIFKNKITNLNSFLRKYVVNALFKLSLKILYLRQNKIYFSTDLLKPFVKKTYRNKTHYNYLINLVKIKKIRKKNIDLLIYNRDYSVKNNYLRDKFLKNILLYNLKIYVVGDYLDLKKVKNLGFISRNQINNLLKRSRFIVNSGENPYNIFTIDAFNNHSTIIYEEKFMNKIQFFNKNKLLFINFTKREEISNFFKQYKKKISKSRLTTNYKKLKNNNLVYFNNVKINYTSNTD